MTVPDLGVTRPPLARMRRSVFDFLNPYLRAVDYLDLFSGTGSYLFEAISRGAATATGVEREALLADAINAHARTLGIGDRLMCLRDDVFAAVARLHSLEAICSYSWPGNVRELENMIERAVVMCNEKTVSRRHFPVVTDAQQDDLNEIPPIPGSTLAEIEKYSIQRTLEAVGGNRTRAAEILGISLRKIQYKLKEY